MSENKLSAVVLAGGLASSKLAGRDLAPYEALIKINARPMVEWTVAALIDSHHIGTVIIVGPVARLTDECRLPAGVKLVEGGKTLFDSVRNALTVLPDGNANQQVLFVTVDLPLLSAAAIEDFINKAQPKEADLYYPIVSEATYVQKYPGFKRTYVRLHEGRFTGGNLFLLRPSIVEACTAVASNIFALRKEPLKLARLIGWRFVIKLAMGQARLDETVAKFSKLLDINGVAIISEYPELAADIDKLDDWILAQQILSKNGGSPL